MAVLKTFVKGGHNNAIDRIAIPIQQILKLERSVTNKCSYSKLETVNFNRSAKPTCPQICTNFWVNFLMNDKSTWENVNNSNKGEKTCSGVSIMRNASFNISPINQN